MKGEEKENFMNQIMAQVLQGYIRAVCWNTKQENHKVLLSRQLIFITIQNRSARTKIKWAVLLSSHVYGLWNAYLL